MDLNHLCAPQGSPVWDTSREGESQLGHLGGQWRGVEGRRDACLCSGRGVCEGQCASGDSRRVVWVEWRGQGRAEGGREQASSGDPARSRTLEALWTMFFFSRDFTKEGRKCPSTPVRCKSRISS